MSNIKNLLKLEIGEPIPGSEFEAADAVTLETVNKLKLEGSFEPQGPTPVFFDNAQLFKCTLPAFDLEAILPFDVEEKILRPYLRDKVLYQKNKDGSQSLIGFGYMDKEKLISINLQQGYNLHDVEGNLTTYVQGSNSEGMVYNVEIFDEIYSMSLNWIQPWEERTFQGLIRIDKEKGFLYNLVLPIKQQMITLNGQEDQLLVIGPSKRIFKEKPNFHDFELDINYGQRIIEPLAQAIKQKNIEQAGQKIYEIIRPVSKHLEQFIDD